MVGANHGPGRSVNLASVQTAADTSPFWQYALAAIAFTAGFWLICLLAVAVPRAVRRWRDAKHVIHQAEAFVRQADRQRQR